MRRSLLVTTFLVAACSQRATPEDEYAAREAARPAMPVPAAPVPGMTPGPAPDATAGPGDVAVRIEWPAGVDEPTDSPAVLFVFVRPAGASAGPPLAVRRVAAPSFPVELTIGPGDAMIPGTAFPDRVTVEARLDDDGIATTRGPDDWSARSEPVAPGGEVRLVLAAADAP